MPYFTTRTLNAEDSANLDLQTQMSSVDVLRTLLCLSDVTELIGDNVTDDDLDLEVEVVVRRKHNGVRKGIYCGRTTVRDALANPDVRDLVGLPV